MTKTPWRPASLALATALLSCSTVQAGIHARFSDLGGPPIVGQSTVQGFEGSINVNTLQWGVGVGVGNIPNTRGDRLVSPPSISEIAWTQGFDASFNGLNAALFGAGSYDSTFSVVNGARPDSYLTMRTSRGAIGSLSVGSSGGRPEIAASHAFRAFELTYNPGGLDRPGGPTSAGYDSILGEASGATGRAGLAPAGGGALASGLYLRLGNGPGSIAGDSTDQGYENWIHLGSFQMGVGVGLSPNPTGFTHSVPSVSELTVTHDFDGAVPAMLSNLLRGNNIGQATIELVQGGSAGPFTSMQLELDNVIFSGLTFNSVGSQTSVSTSMNFTGFTQTIWEPGAPGLAPTSSTFSYDMATRQVRGGAVAAQSISGFGAGMLAPVIAQPIPEPQTWALMAGGIALLAGLRRRRAA